MICAVMQPYLFPYIGYYQLAYASDFFVFYDDVTYIKQGYINRNNILTNNSPARFTYPISNASSYSKINELSYLSDKKILKTIEQSYSKCPFFDQVFEKIVTVMHSADRSVSQLNALSIKMVFDHLGLQKTFLFSSQLKTKPDFDRSERLIKINKELGCEHYINSPGGKELYNKSHFAKSGIKLDFIKPNLIEYPQKSSTFIPNLSIIDVLMNCEKKEIIDMLNRYELI